MTPHHRRLRGPGTEALVAALAASFAVLGAGCTRPADPGGAGGTGSAAKPVAFTTASGVAMVWLPGGEFVMGSDRGEPDEAPAHPVRLLPFAIDALEVTHARFAEAELPNPSKWQDVPEKPVNQVRWRDAKQYCNERSLLEGLEPCYDESQPGWPCDFSKDGYRLPTEAEWEFAARCGTTGDFPFGSESRLPAFAWFAGNSGASTHPSGTRRANAWGIHDLLGNVAEWCHDVYDPGYYAASPTDDPTGPEPGGTDARRVVRGGSWKTDAALCRVSFRQGQTTGDSDACFASDDCGFRCVRRLAAPPDGAGAAE